MKVTLQELFLYSCIHCGNQDPTKFKRHWQAGEHETTLEAVECTRCGHHLRMQRVWAQRLRAARGYVVTQERRKFRPEPSGIGHVVNPYLPCPECGSTDHFVVENYSLMWHDGDVYCHNLEQHVSGEKVYVRGYDAG